MKISILIPTYNAENYINEFIPKLMEQELPSGFTSEIIMVDSSSSDKTEMLIKSHYTNVKFYTIPNKDFNHGNTRNMLSRLATGDFLLFMTQDAIPYNNQLLKELVKNFSDPNVQIVNARQIPKEDANPLEKFARSFNYPDERSIKDKTKIPEMGIKTFFNSNVCSMYRASLFNGKEFKGFPENIILNEDIILSFHVIMKGYKVIYENKAIVYHSHNYNLKQQFKRYFDIGIAFQESKFMLENISNEKEGVRMVKEQLSYLFKHKHFFYIFYSVLEAATKFFGYNLGKKHDLLSINMKRKFSAYMK